MEPGNEAGEWSLGMRPGRPQAEGTYFQLTFFE